MGTLPFGDQLFHEVNRTGVNRRDHTNGSGQQCGRSRRSRCNEKGQGGVMYVSLACEIMLHRNATGIRGQAHVHPRSSRNAVSRDL